jgi:hypothetical protein
MLDYHPMDAPHTQVAKDTADAFARFAEALGTARVDISVIDLYASVLGELELHDFGDERLREHMAEQIVSRVQRDV